MDDDPRSDGRHGPRLGDEIGRKAERKLRGRREKRRTVWFGLGMFGLVGWAVAVARVFGRRLGGGVGWN